MYLAAGAGGVVALVTLIDAAAEAVPAPVAASVPPARPVVYSLEAVPKPQTSSISGPSPEGKVKA